MEKKEKNSINDVETVTISRIEYENMQAQIQWLMEQLQLTKKKQFGSSSEKMQEQIAEQQCLFNEAESCRDTKQPEEKVAVAGHSRRKSGSVKDIVPDDIPEEIVEHKLSEAERICPRCGSEMQVIGKEEHLELKFKPAEATLVRHIYYSYACMNCKENDIQTPVVQTPRLSQVIPGSFASPEAIAHIMVQKFVMGSPLYRQEQEWNRAGVMLSRQTMSNWILDASDTWLQPIYDELHKRLLQHEILHADETTLQVLKEPEKAAQTKSYMWLYRTSGDAEHPIVLYDYRTSHRRENVIDFLDDWSGWLHCDGLSVYNGLRDSIRTVGCMAHARRKFYDAMTCGAKEKGQSYSAAKEGLAYFNKLFDMEKELAGLTAEDRYTQRLEREKPVLDALLVWADSISAAPKSHLGKAIFYLKAHWPELVRYLEDGRLEISNNRAERSIKPFVMGRKNFLFANTPSGANGSAVIYSLIETAKENGLDPYRYLTYIFTNAPIEKETNPDWPLSFLPECVQI